jgi:hypothetical protein
MKNGYLAICKVGAGHLVDCQVSREKKNGYCWVGEVVSVHLADCPVSRAMKNGCCSFRKVGPDMSNTKAASARSHSLKTGHWQLSRVGTAAATAGAFRLDEGYPGTWAEAGARRVR